MARGGAAGVAPASLASGGLTAAVLAGWTVISFLAPPILRAANLPPPGNEYGLLGLLRYLAFLQWSDWRRILFVAVPVGILPALSLLLWRRQDQVARALTLVTVAYFLFFFFQAYTVLHHYIPAMVLPLVVFWRIEPALPERWRPAVLAATAVAGLLALVVSLPAHPQLDTSARRVGAAIADCIGGYETASPGAYRRSTLFAQLFPYDWDPRVPDGELRRLAPHLELLRSSQSVDLPGRRRAAGADQLRLAACI